MSLGERGSYARPLTTQQSVLNELRGWLLSGRFKPGDRILQEEVAQELAMSVIPVREALKTLQSEGQLVHIPHRGFFAASLSKDELIELSEIRAVLEGMAVDRALPRFGEEHAKVMEDLLEQMRVADEADDIVSLAQLDRRFHFTLFEAAGQSQLTKVIATTWDYSDPYRGAFFAHKEHRMRTHAEHREILQAASNRDARLLKQLSETHRLSPLNAIG